MAKELLIVNGAHSTQARALLGLCGDRYDLRLLSRHDEAPEEGRGEGHRHLKCDSLDPGQVADVMGSIAEEGRTIAGYAHFLGSVLLKPLHLTTLQEWDDTFAINVRSVFLALKVLMPVLMKQKKGNVVLVSSVAARIGLANHEAIAAAKGAIASLVPSLAATYANQNVRVNGVSPGLIDAPLSARIVGNEVNLKASLAMSAIKRVGEGRDVALLIDFLLDDTRSGFITGEVLAVDGGVGRVKLPPKL
jgi:NAD(P)-dependent dehydrogenase (short-subunit alcohol dehydrogenase family)